MAESEEEFKEQKEDPHKYDIRSKKDRKGAFEKAEISIGLDEYDDIFSDFDPRAYLVRALSHDFLDEAKRAVLGRDEEKLELRFIVPENKRDQKLEWVIRKRLHNHFIKHSQMLRQELSKSKKKSLLLAFGGMIVMFLASLVAIMDSGNVFQKFIFVLLEPTGWFMVWFGLDKLFYLSEHKKSEYAFYEKMSKCEIFFTGH